MGRGLRFVIWLKIWMERRREVFFFELDGCLRRIGVRGIVCACLTTTAFGVVSKIRCSCTN